MSNRRKDNPWSRLNARRHALIDKELDGTLTPTEIIVRQITDGLARITDLENHLLCGR